MPSSYNGWTASPNPAAIGIVPFEPVPGVKFPGGIKGGDVKTIFTYLVQQLNARVEKAAEYRPGDDWGYAYRANVNNPSVLSCHASGTAIDYNATQHPNRQKYTWSNQQSREIRRIVDVELAGVIRWLEGYDEMHFEIRGDRVAVAKVAKKIRDAAVDPEPPEPEPPATIPEDDMPWVMQAPGKSQRLMAGPVAIPITTETLNSALLSRTPVIVVTAKEYDAAIAQVIRALD